MACWQQVVVLEEQEEEEEARWSQQAGRGSWR
jgi:hypothetical protein